MAKIDILELMAKFTCMMNLLISIILITLVLIAFKLFMVCDLAAENLALRQQLAALNRTLKRPKIKTRDRIFWVMLSKFWTKWRDVRMDGLRL